MFTIVVRTLDAKGDVSNTSFSGKFPERKEAVDQLNRMVKKLNPNVGYDPKQDSWWIRENGRASCIRVRS